MMMNFYRRYRLQHQVIRYSKVFSNQPRSNTILSMYPSHTGTNSIQNVLWHLIKITKLTPPPPKKRKIWQKMKNRLVCSNCFKPGRLQEVCPLGLYLILRLPQNGFYGTHQLEQCNCGGNFHTIGQKRTAIRRVNANNNLCVP